MMQYIPVESSFNLGLPYLGLPNLVRRKQFASTVANTGFPGWGAVGALTYYLARFCLKLHENERNGPSGVAYLASPPRIRQ